ncbi:hypothetical protein HYDPIDRAFT_155331 [Hydnomerulius pinastri MD-312]|uniref:G domain-containing protein n=1 Tax=Hydnomerulius pinastri MD-312 TaxID=994086 RepID=A0A0C9W8I1_9AGAM|nr:hypothetical protein HYDPIDRAFT_155331 [Hydnomerulius pinastri MD-312]
MSTSTHIASTLDHSRQLSRSTDATSFERDFPPSVPTGPPKNIIIFGEMGVGKSSLVNLIAGKKLADTSSKAESCTFAATPHPVTVNSQPFVLFDTAGMNEPQNLSNKKEARDAFVDAAKQAVQLISKLDREGGIALLVFCMQGGRVTRSMQHAYTFFVNVLCNDRVPVAVIATKLETEEDMDGWWEENKELLDRYGVASNGHACITATTGYKGCYQERYDQSRVKVHKLLLELSAGDPYKEPKENWVTRLVLHMRRILPPAFTDRELQKKLVKSCGLTESEAKDVVQSIRKEEKIKKKGGRV